jgi:L-ascorbate metabolism protein UlaG (beta-lactamase superfamily)
MRVRWFGQAAFRLQGERHAVMIDPFGRLPEAARARGLRFAYPPVQGVGADLVLVTHEHFDHNAVEGIEGEPAVVRLAGTHETPVGTVVGVASEHDAEAGTRRGPNAMYRFALDGMDIAHLGDLGQPALRPEHFLGPLEPFLDAVDAEVRTVARPETEIDELPDARQVLVLQPPEPE